MCRDSVCDVSGNIDCDALVCIDVVRNSMVVSIDGQDNVGVNEVTWLCVIDEDTSKRSLAKGVLRLTCWYGRREIMVEMGKLADLVCLMSRLMVNNIG